MAVSGDIVTVLRQQGRWAVIAEVSNPSPPGYLLANPNGDIGKVYLTAAEREITVVVAAPTFTPGMSVNVDDEAAEVVSDNGTSVRVRRQNRVELAGGGFHSWAGESDILKGEIVADNLALFT